MRSNLSAIAGLAGLMLVGLAFFAQRLGLDHNAAWGMGRYLLLALGLVLVVGSLFFYFVPSRIGRVYFLAALIELLVMAVYVWFISVGTWTNWPGSTKYYDMLATSFQHGQLSLQMQPDPALLAMPDPYDVQARKSQPDIPYLFDGSLYNGKFYLYWGPVPALILAAIKFIFPQPVGDQVLVFAFVASLSVFQTLLILKLWRRFFEKLPAWTVWLAVLLSGLMVPLTWILNQPQVYEASLAAGQFFLIGGLYFIFTGLDRSSPSFWRLAGAGIFWACAIASRTVLLLPVGFMACMLLIWLVAKRIYVEHPRRAVGSLVSLILPLAIGVMALGWYNWARFGSVFETGLRYQLSGIDYRDHFQDIFLTSYLPINLKNYLLNPFLALPEFPYLKPVSPDRFLAQADSVPGFYYSREKLAGLLYVAPFLLFALFGLGWALRDSWKKHRASDPATSGEDQDLLRWVTVSLGGTAFMAFMTILLYYYCTMRFTADFMPAATLLALVGFWQGYARLVQSRLWQPLYAVLAMGLALETLVAGNLLSVTGGADRFSVLNPALLKLIAKLLEH